MEENYNKMYERAPGLTIGFHGCNQETFEKVVRQGEALKKSENTYDWLGNGIYFWENSYKRAREWAESHYKGQAAVIGAVINLGYCLNLIDYYNMAILKSGYQLLQMRCQQSRTPMPENRKRNQNEDVLLRDLDCAVIEQIHLFNKEQGYPEYDSAKGFFVEGKPLYPGSEFREKTHVQLCVRNLNCIKGYFRPVEENKLYSHV